MPGADLRLGAAELRLARVEIEEGEVAARVAGSGEGRGLGERGEEWGEETQEERAQASVGSKRTHVRDMVTGTSPLLGGE